MASRGVKAGPSLKGSGLPFRARFTDVAAKAGLHEVTVCGHPNHADYVIEAMGCGSRFSITTTTAGWISWSSPVPLWRSSQRCLQSSLQEQSRRHVHRCYRQGGLLRTGYWYGVTVGDYNNDGFEDLFITGCPHNALYRNNGDGTFTDVTKEAGLLNAEPRFGSGCTFLDYDRDGQLDLFVSNYVPFDPNSVPRAGELSSCNAEKVFCGPRGLPYGRHCLYRNNGDGTFPDVTLLQESEGRTPDTVSRSSRWILITTAGRISTLPAIPLRVCCFAISTTVRSPRRPGTRSRSE